MERRQYDKIQKEREEGTAGVGIFYMIGSGISRIFHGCVGAAKWCIRLGWNLCCIGASLLVGFFGLFCLYGLGVTLVLLLQGYPLLGITIGCLGLVLCMFSLACFGFTLRWIPERQREAERMGNKDRERKELVRRQEIRRRELRQRSYNTGTDKAKADRNRTDEIGIDRMQADRNETNEIEIDRMQADRNEMNEIEIDRMQVDRNETDEIEIDRMQEDRNEMNEAEIDRMQTDRTEIDKIEKEESASISETDMDTKGGEQNA